MPVDNILFVLRLPAMGVDSSHFPSSHVESISFGYSIYFISIKIYLFSASSFVFGKLKNNECIGCTSMLLNRSERLHPDRDVYGVWSSLPRIIDEVEFSNSNVIFLRGEINSLPTQSFLGMLRSVGRRRRIILPDN